MSCKTAIGVATAMKEKYGDRLELKIYTMDSQEAKGYEFRSATNVLFNKKVVSLDTATDKNKMETYLSDRI